MSHNISTILFMANYNILAHKTFVMTHQIRFRNGAHDSSDEKSLISNFSK